MEEKVFSLSKNSEVITATYQTRYDPCDGIIQVQIPCTSPKMELDIVNLDMEQVMGSVMGSSVLVSACYLQRVDTTKGGDIDWQRGLEELRQMGPSCSKEETVSVETPVVGAMKSGIQDNSQDSKRLEPIVDKCRDSIGYEAIEDKCTDRESEQQNKQHLVSSVYKYEKETYADNVTTSLFVTGAGKQVKAKQVSNEWAKSFLSDIVVEAPYQRNTSTVANSANMSMEEKLQVKSNTPNDEIVKENKQDVIFTTGKGKHMSISNESLQHASMILHDTSHDKVPANGGLKPKRKLTNSVLKRARKALYDNQTPKKTNDNSNFASNEEFNTPLLRSYPDSILPMKRTPSGITDSVLRRRNRVENAKDISDTCFPKPGNKVKKQIPFRYTCCSISGQPIKDKTNVKKVALKELQKRKLQNMCSTYANDPELFDCIQDPVHFRFKNSRMNLDNTFSLSPDISYLTPDGNSEVGLEEFTEHLRQLYPDADGPVTKVGTNSWIRNAYRLLVWKLASLEVFFHPFLKNNLNARNLSIEFSKRLEREWNRGHRSILHKIVERDALVGSHYILFISDILDDDLIEVSDGWYCICAKIDSFLCEAILKKKLFKGCKISVCSASFHHFNENDPQQTVLFLHFNGVRRVRWYCKLGPRRYPPVLHCMNSIRATGGQIPCLEVVIERSFPVRYVEKEQLDESKTRKVFRNEEDEERVVMRRNDDISVRLDEIFKNEGGAVMQTTNSLVEFERDVSRMTEILVVDRRGKRRAYVTFWRPTDNAIEVLRNEGYVVRLYGIIPSKRLVDCEVLHLAVPSKMPIQVRSAEAVDTFWIPRHALSVSAIASLSCGEEFDSCFVILLVGDLQYGHSRFIYLLQTVEGPITAVKLFDEQAKNVPSIMKRASMSSKKLALVAVKNLKFICCDRRCGIYFCHHTSRCVWLSEHEAKKSNEFVEKIADLQKLVNERFPDLMTWRQRLVDFVNGKLSNLYPLRGTKIARVWEILNDFSSS